MQCCHVVRAIIVNRHMWICCLHVDSYCFESTLIGAVVSPCVLKVIEGHQGSVGCLYLDEWHILTGGTDCQVMAWSTNSDFKKCLMKYRHPM